MAVLLMVLAGVMVDPLDPVPGPAWVAVVLLQLAHAVPAWRRRYGPLTLVLQALLSPWAGSGAPGLVAASALLIVRGPARWAAFCAVVAAAAVLGAGDPYTVVNAAVNALIQGLIVFAVTRLRDLGVALAAARHELAEATVAAERARSSRELADALGSALTAIVALAGRGRAAEAVAVARSAADRARRPPPPPDRPAPPGLAPRLAVPVLVVVHAGFSFVAVVFLWQEGLAPLPFAGALALVCAVAALQIRHSLPRPSGDRLPHTSWTLPLQLVLSLAPLFLPGTSYPQLVGLGAGALLVLWPRRAAYPSVAVVLGVTAAVMAVRDVSWADNLYWTVNALSIAVMFYGLALHAELVGRLERVRLDLAAVALAGERRRIFRDVHDLLGYSLSAIAVKGELARRVPERAEAELADVVRIARGALADLAAIPDDGAAPSLTVELASAREILTAAGVTADVAAPGLPARLALPGHVDALFATVLREAVTNALRHGGGLHCRIDLTFEPGPDGGVARLHVRNDLPTPPTPRTTTPPSSPTETAQPYDPAKAARAGSTSSAGGGSVSGAPRVGDVSGAARAGASETALAGSVSGAACAGGASEAVCAGGVSETARAGVSETACAGGASEVARVGSGRGHLRERVAAAGGEMWAGVRGDGFEVVVLQPAGLGRDADGVEAVAGP
ncbi:histidine kinase [Actinocorallia sp. A-T 12471]|uniref:sensor histidine kinase n=1 Tax=Actinocorallia sp. A-T 12471 TaxID=3089813 RepID=UPI0029CEA83B|nr:histidine kinase [Actinocorallia sp. A-T 12471]MDX6738306.1 histidine kinase [Actinocorallia sp. A-T 12471]